ncbi:MAG: deoxyribonuclease IV [archaeon]|nr:MAG: deoxyribonuclease IV [archaeon]
MLPIEPQVGLHLSIEKSLDLAFDRAEEVGATTFQIFTRNPRTWKFKELTAEQVSAFRSRRKKAGTRSVVAHMPYLPNLASPFAGIMKPSRATLKEEVSRCDELGIDFLVTHLGSHLGAGTMVGVKNVAEAINKALAESGGATTVLLENMAGQKNSVGSSFDELKLILDRVREEHRVAVCLDLCHAFASGFDLTSSAAVENTMSLFDDAVGVDKLRVVHLNDSKGPLGGNLDRHEFVGEGKIGKKGMRAFLRYRGIRERPLIMETPFEDVEGMRRSLRTVRSLLA